MAKKINIQIELSWKNFKIVFSDLLQNMKCWVGFHDWKKIETIEKSRVMKYCKNCLLRKQKNWGKEGDAENGPEWEAMR